MPKAKPDKYRVTMTNGPLQAVDYVPENILDAYVADARTRWASVDVSTEVDFGPGGPDGPTKTPRGLTRKKG